MLNVHCHCLIDPDRAGTNRQFFTISQSSQLQFNRNTESSDCILHLGYDEIDILFALEQMFFLGETSYDVLSNKTLGIIFRQSFHSNKRQKD